jgi:hypothetical protein
MAGWSSLTPGIQDGKRGWMVHWLKSTEQITSSGGLPCRKGSIQLNSSISLEVSGWEVSSA